MDARKVKKSWGSKRGNFFRHQDGGEGGQTSGSSPKGGRSDSFILNNLEHQKMGPILIKALATLAVVIFGGAFILGYRISNYSRDEIGKVVEQVVPDVKFSREGPTLRTEIQSLKDKDRDLNYEMGKCLAFEPRIAFCESWINAPKKGRPK